MNFRDAQNTVVPFGKFRGQTIDQVAATDPGLLWLDWARGARELKSSDSSFDAALCVYLDDPTIARELQVLLR